MADIDGGVSKAQLVRAIAASYPDDRDGWARWLSRMQTDELRALAAKRGVKMDSTPLRSL